MHLSIKFRKASHKIDTEKKDSQMFLNNNKSENDFTNIKKAKDAGMKNRINHEFESKNVN